MSEPEIADDGIERGVRERQALNVAFAELDPWVTRTGKFDHSRCKIDPDRISPTSQCCGCRKTRACRYVQEARAGADLSGVEELRDRKLRDRRKKLGVALGETIMGGAFKRAEGIGVNRH